MCKISVTRGMSRNHGRRHGDFSVIRCRFRLEQCHSMMYNFHSSSRWWNQITAQLCQLSQDVLFRKSIYNDIDATSFRMHKQTTEGRALLRLVKARELAHAEKLNGITDSSRVITARAKMRPGSYDCVAKWFEIDELDLEFFQEFILSQSSVLLVVINTLIQPY